MSTPPLRVTGLSGSGFAPRRHHKQPAATPAAFRARGLLFNLLDPTQIERLDKPSLVSSLHGQIARILFTIPGNIVAPESSWDPVIAARFRAAFQGLLSTMPSACGIFHPFAALSGAAHCVKKYLGRA